MRTRLIGIATTGAVGVAAALAAPAFACSSQAMVKALPNSAPPGAEITVTLVNFTPAEAGGFPVEVRWNTESGAPVATAATTQAYDAQGNAKTYRDEPLSNDVTVRVTVPQGAPRFSTIHAQQRTTKTVYVAKTSFEVTPAVTTSTSPGAGGADPAPPPPAASGPQPQRPLSVGGEVPGPAAAQALPAGAGRGSQPGAPQASAAAAPSGAPGAPSLTPAGVVADESEPEAGLEPLVGEEDLWSGVAAAGPSMLDASPGDPGSGSSTGAIGAALLAGGLMALGGTGIALGRRRLVQARAHR